jgi:hypothetical protein
MSGHYQTGRRASIVDFLQPGPEREPRKEMAMDIPGFTGEATLGKASQTYRASGVWRGGVGDGPSVVVPSRWDWHNVWDGAMEGIMFPELELPGRLRRGCDLSCAEDRAACFRANGTRETCDQVELACRMHCFFSLSDF